MKIMMALFGVNMAKLVKSPWLWNKFDDVEENV